MLENYAQIAKSKYFIKKEINKLCTLLNLPSIKIKYHDLFNIDAFADFDNRIITFNIALLEGSGLYKFYNPQERQAIIESIIIHELEHFKQRQEIIITPIKLGVQNIIIKNTTDYPFSKMCLYIKGSENKFLKNVYVLQPNEYDAFLKGSSIIKKYIQTYKLSNLSNRAFVIDNAISFIKNYFNVENPVEEISNALMNLYDNGNRKCDDRIQDLVVRCAICSYEDENDFGIDKISLLLGEEYEKSLLIQKKSLDNVEINLDN